MELWDTAGQEAFENLRRLSYPGTDVFVLVYDVGNASSLDNIMNKWVPEIHAEFDEVA